MSVLRAIRDDLVEKRLWPLAVVLVLALIAVPVVLARSGGSAPPPPASAALPVLDPAGPDGAAVQKVVLQETRRAAPKGRFHDPFRPAKGSTASVPKSEASAPGVAATVKPDPAPAPASSTGSAGSTSGATVTPSAPAVTSTPVTVAATPAPAPVPTGFAAGYRTNFSWGAPGAPKRTQDAVRLTPLKAGADPALVFLGVKKDGRTALFFVAGDATATGDGRCWPTAALCHIVAMRAGDSEFLDVATDQGVAQYELHLDRLAERRAATRGAAAKWRAKVSKKGRAVVAAATGTARSLVHRFAYAKRSGVLVFRPNLKVQHTP